MTSLILFLLLNYVLPLYKNVLPGHKQTSALYVAGWWLYDCSFICLKPAIRILLCSPPPVHGVSLEADWTPIPPPKSLEFVRAWLNKLRAHQWETKKKTDFFLFCYAMKEFVMEPKNNETFMTANSPSDSQSEASTLPNSGHLCSPVSFTTLLSMVMQIFLLWVLRHAACAINVNYEARLKSRVHVWKKANVAFRECSIWCGSRGELS